MSEVQARRCRPFPATSPPSGRNRNRRHSFSAWEAGPLLDGSAAALDGGIETIHEGGDHWIVVGPVSALCRYESSAAPLVLSSGRYAQLAP
jgi:flavin reductase (DIM6/NTAB) family NADH-FMN oxidoreductase RutF